MLMFRYRYLYDADVWNQEFWEGDLVYYTCEDPINDGIVINPSLKGPDGGQVGFEKSQIVFLEIFCSSHTSSFLS
jgi:hypothetical protein